MNDAYSRFPDRDGNFIEQFQTTGFDSRTFELYVSELLHSEKFKIIGDEPHPDFTVEKNGVRLSIECTTANRTSTGDGVIRPYKPFSEVELDEEGVKSKHKSEIPIRIGGALRNKMQHRIGRRSKDPKAYWDLPHVRETPFVLAIQTFHESGSLMFSSSATAEYLYRTHHKPSWDAAGNLVVTSETIARHGIGEKVIPSGFFDLPDSENVSAVLWTNAGTIPKFLRMAITGLYPDPDISIVRYGTFYDFDPNAHVPRPFSYIVGGPHTPEETWAQQTVLFHNPRANHPLPRKLFETVTEGNLEDGKCVDTFKADFCPYMSVNEILTGPGHRQAALSLAEQIFLHLEATYGPLRDSKPADLY
ncbi:hypothetical protein [Methylosinus sp. RM1]|uniref:hypothetical protein n=1 Tax=Methylosinus sp. RM1 TaxID=2583817 RepID=UPI001A9C9C3B|nr:hypothetical protein [Methylosinus sp. RM1]